MNILRAVVVNQKSNQTELDATGHKPSANQFYLMHSATAVDLSAFPICSINYLLFFRIAYYLLVTLRLWLNFADRAERRGTTQLTIKINVKADACCLPHLSFTHVFLGESLLLAPIAYTLW